MHGISSTRLVRSDLLFVRSSYFIYSQQKGKQKCRDLKENAQDYFTKIDQGYTKTALLFVLAKLCPTVLFISEYEYHVACSLWNISNTNSSNHVKEMKGKKLTP